MKCLSTVSLKQQITWQDEEKLYSQLDCADVESFGDNSSIKMLKLMLLSTSPPPSKRYFDVQQLVGDFRP